MFTGTAEELRRRERKAVEYAAQIAELLNKIDDLKVGIILPNPNKIAGPGFILRPVNDRWTVQH